MTPKKENNVIKIKSLNEAIVDNKDNNSNKDNNEDTLIIKVKKVLLNGVKLYKIMDIKSYYIDELPVQYLNEKPYCYITDDIFIIEAKDNNRIELELDCFIKEDDYKIMIDNLKECGSRLHKINEELKVIRSEWRGTEEINI